MFCSLNTRGTSVFCFVLAKQEHLFDTLQFSNIAYTTTPGGNGVRKSK